MIALDSLDSIFENDAEKFDAKLYLYKRLKNEPDYFSLFNPFKDFVDINKSANIGYIYEIEKYIEKALTRPANEVDTIQVYYDLVSSIIYNIDSIIAITTWSESNRTYLNQMRDDLSRVQIKLDSLDLIYDVHKQLYLDSAWALLPQIDTSEGDYFKFYETYLQYRIQILDEGYTSLDTNDSQTLLTLADNCPVNSGSAVGGIQGLLNYCSYLSLQESIYACQPTMTIDTLHPLLIDSSPFMKYDYWVKADENGVLGNIDKKGQFQNPDEVFTTKVSIYSLDGRKIKELSSVDQEIRYTSFANIWSDLPEGLYLIMKRTSDNQILTYKYFNSHK